MSQQDNKQFTFNISLSVLNHLGRNLYRNFITILGEAISNSWDADAKNVWLFIDKESDELIIKDDGHGMSEDDFRNKFLRVGYTKRGADGTLIKSPGGRHFIGRKGIGKLALLSCAKIVSVISKVDDSDYVGGTINNTVLDKVISEDSPHYNLEGIQHKLFTPYKINHKHGTIIHFKGINDGIKNSAPYLKKLLALYFRFSLIDKTFKIFLNKKEITESNLSSLAEKTQFLWNINTLDDPYITQELKHLRRSNLLLISEVKVKGFIASVEKPRYLKIDNTEEKTGIDLFVNGRLRERNILKHMPNYSTRHIASYLYGQIHFDELDIGKKDSFTTSREGIKDGDPTYNNLLDILRTGVLEKISDEWDKWRLEIDEEGDDENPRKTVKERKAKSLYNLASKDYKSTNKKTNKWIKELESDAEFNISSYTDCFLSENLIRKYIQNSKIVLTKETKEVVKTWKDNEVENKKKGNISIDITEFFNDLNYLAMDDLANLFDKKPSSKASLSRDAKEYKPMRNAVAHTAKLTQVAKNKLTTVYENIKGRLGKLLSEDSKIPK